MSSPSDASAAVATISLSPIFAIRIVSVIVPSRSAARPASGPARSVGCASQPIAITSAAQRTCSECGTGARPIRAIGRRHLRLERLKSLIHSKLTQSRSLVTYRPVLFGKLQDFCLAKDPGFIGLVAMITGSTLQEDIAAITRRVVEQGRNILGLNLPGKMPSTYDLQTSAPRGSPAADPAQL